MSVTTFIKGYVKRELNKDTFVAKVARRMISRKTEWLDTWKCAKHDFVLEWRYLGWKRAGRDYWKLSSELVYWCHKLEKGLCLPGPKDFFGETAAAKVLELLREWTDVGLSKTHPVYCGVVEVIRSYHAHLIKGALPNAEKNNFLLKLEQLLEEAPIDDGVSTPITLQPTPPDSANAFRALCISRRSVRNFDGSAVDFKLVEAAAKTAQLSPSVCNRQPWHLHLYRDSDQISKILDLQNGAKGFGLVPSLAIVTADYGSFKGFRERNEPSLDAGLFMMSFLLAAQSLGLATCCLNWCVLPEVDTAGHKIARIPRNEKIVACVAIGRAAPGCVVPRSARRPMSDVLICHD